MKFNFSEHGQVSTELMMGIIILFIFLIIVFAQNFFVSDSTESASTVYKNKGECASLAFTISKIYSEGNGAKTDFYLASDANIISAQKFVQMGEELCSFLARTNDANLVSGDLTLTNVNGVIVFS